MLALDRGGACTGVAYRLPAPVAIDELHLLWRREMVVGSYRPKWVRVHSGDRIIVALAFTVKHDHPQYAGKLPIEEQARVMLAKVCMTPLGCPVVPEVYSSIARSFS